MAIREKAEVNIVVNGDSAERVLELLQRDAKELEKSLKEAQAAGNIKLSGELNKKIRQNQSAVRTLTKDTKNYQDVLKNLNHSSLKQLYAAANTLRKEIKYLDPTTKEWMEKFKQLQTIDARLRAVNNTMRGTQSISSNLANTFNKYFGVVTTAIASVTGLSLGLKKAAEQAAELDDTYSDVMKTTELTREQVVLMNEEFKKMDTRTSREALNLLARDAGKLGITGTENILEFVRAADKINVALGEDLGEGAIRNIGKISDVFGLTESMGIEKSFLSIGSAINALGQASTANEQYLVDFTQRLAGIGAQTGISIQNILGFASGLDQSAMKVEMAATAFQKFLMKMYSDTATFAGYAGMKVEEFSDLLSTDANAAVVKVLKSLNDKDGFKALVPVFQEMGLDGARAVSVLASMATNIDAVTDAQKMANVEFEKATSLQNEFDTKNNNRMAQLEKARKRFKDTITEFGETLSPVMLKTTNLTTIAIKFLAKHWKEVLTLAASIATLTAALKIYHSWSKIVNTLQATSVVTTKALSAAYYLLTGRITQAKAAATALKGAFSTSALGIIITAITAIGVGIYKITQNARDARKAMKEFYVESEKLKFEADGLFNILKNNAAGTQIYKDALSKLTELYGPYISHLINEKGELTDIEAARKLVNDQIVRTIALKMKEESLHKITEKALDKQSDQYNVIIAKMKNYANVGDDAAKVMTDEAVRMLKAGASIDEVMKKISNSDSSDGERYNRLRMQIALFRVYYDEFVSDIEKESKRFDTLMLGTSGIDEVKKIAAEKLSVQQELSEEETKITEEQFKTQLALFDAQNTIDQNNLKKSYLQKKITKEEYENQLEAMTISYLAKRNSLYIKAGQDNSDAESKYIDALLAQMKKVDDALSKLLNVKVTINLDVDSDIDIPESEFPELEQFKQMQEQVNKIRSDIANKGFANRYKTEMANLNKLHNEGMISEKEYEKAKMQMKLQYASEMASLTNQFANQAVNLVTAMSDLEYNRLESNKERELAMYGDTADKRAEIENKYEQKKLEIQKKYADIDMGVKIAQAISSAALSIIQCFAQLGPIGGAISAALIGTTTAFQIASIVQQRNAIKNSSVNSSSSSGSRTVTGYYPGGYTDESSDDYREVGIVHANEWVAPAWMTRSYPTVFKSLENMRRSRSTSSGSPSRGYLDGGNVTPDDTSVVDGGSSDISALMREIIALLKSLRSNPIKAYTLLSDSNAAQETSNRFKKATGKK